MNYIDPPRKLLLNVDRLAAIRSGLKPPPVNVEIDLSNRCNLGCRGCHMSYLHSKGPHAAQATLDSGDYMDPLLMERILAQLQDAGVRSVTWSGGGEPTTSDIERAVDACALPQGLYSNGTLIDGILARFLKPRLDWVYVSLDRYDRESYRAYKGVEGFAKAIAGIENLAQAPGKATVGVGFLISADNWQYIPRMAALGKGLGADYVQFRPEIRFRLSEPIVAEGNEWIDRALPLLDEWSREPGVIIDLARFQMYRDWHGHGYHTCYWTQLQTVITPDGRVWQCCNRRGFPGDSLGDLKEESFAEIWQRSAPYTVNDHCRVMCRGHIPNLTLDQMMREDPHGRFI
jgi:MoaA/NifB/PqqE/SkfB family radical SAM enzyme